MNKRNLKIHFYFIIPALLIIAAAGVSPFFEAITSSFYHDTYGVRMFAGLDNFRYLADDAGFSYSLNITALWSVTSTVLSLFLGFILAGMLSGRKRFSTLIYGALLIPWGIPVYIAVPLWRALIHGNGGVSVLTAVFGIKANLMLDPVAGFISCMLVNIWMTVPLTAFVLHGALKKIPKSTVEAAVTDGAGPGVIAAYIYLPQMKVSLLAMGLLNFIKAFKEFTLVFLMTAGGPPLMSGITERYVIGATTTMDTFLFDVFNNTDDFGISAAYSVIMAAIVVLLMLIWFVTRNRRYDDKKKYRLLVVITAAMQVVFSGKTGIIFALLYISGIKNKKVFFAAALMQTGWLIYCIAANGFLSGFSPAIFPVLFTVYYFRTAADKFSHNLFNPSLLNTINFGLNTVTSVFLIIASAAVLYLLLWMSLSGVSACYIDGPLPPHAGLESFRSVFAEQ